MQRTAHSVRPIPLIIAIILGVFGTVLVAYKVWNNQYNLVRVSLMQERQQALQLLTAELEGNIQNMVSQSLRYLFADDIALMPGRINEIKRHFPALDQVLRFDAAGGMLYCIPGPSKIDDYRRWLSAKLNNAVANRQPDDLTIGSFPEVYQGENVLFFFAPIPQEIPQLQGSGWIVLRYSLDTLLTSYWQPLRTEFISTHGGNVSLSENRVANPGRQTVHEPLSRYLPGWMLNYQPDSSRLDTIAQQQGLLLGLLILGLGSLPIAAGLVYWWYSRKDLIMAQTRADFVAHVSHELKTPLSLIRMYAETLEMSRIKNPQKARQYLQTIIQESDQLAGLIDQILDYASLENGHFKYQLSHTNLSHTVSNLADKFRPKLEQQGFLLATDIDPNIPRQTHDSVAISRALMNLLDNAIKYSVNGHTIFLRLKLENNRLILEVSDRGQGIPDGVNEALLEPFVRGPENQHNSVKGTGLGLALVSHTVKAHGAKFEINRRQGGGTQARIIFPEVNARIQAA